MNIFSKKSVKSTIISSKFTYNSENFILGKDETLQPKFAKIFGLNYSVNIYYLKIKSPELNLNKDSINIYLPMQYKNYNNQNLLNVILFKMYKKITEQEIELIMEKARHLFGFAPEDYEVKKINNTLAYCNTELQIIYFNPYIATYEKEIIEYIVFHEFCHLKYKTHSAKFYEMLKKYIPNYEKISKKIPNLKY